MSNTLYSIALSIALRSRLRMALRLLEEYGSAEAAWLHLSDDLKGDAMARAEQEWEWIEAHHIRVWSVTDKDYPYRLHQCPDRPIVLYSKGNVNPSDGYIVSIVGTRRPTERGKELTNTLVRELGERLEKVTIVSGGAYGIDITAHRAAIQYGLPTIIVPAHGLDRIYPTQHRNDAIRALEHGGLLTEFPSGIEPLAPYFVQRNRIVAGLADAVVVVESKNKGGSLITAQMALDYDRELFAFPGRVSDEISTGCNALIRSQKAHLITCADDLIEAMNWTRRDQKTPVQTQMTELIVDLTERQKQLVDKLQEAEEGLHINLIVMETGLNYSDVAGDLTMLEVQGVVRSLPGGIYRLVRK